MNRRLSHWLTKCFPSSWKIEYGEEFEDFLSKQSLRFFGVLDVLRSAVKEWLRLPSLRLIRFFLLWCSGLFAAGSMLALPMWRALILPVHSVLRQQAIRPPFLIATTPNEGLEVVRLGVPLLFITFALYPIFLIVATKLVTRYGDETMHAWAKSFVWSSGIAFGISLIVGLFSWRYGWPIELLLASLRPVFSIGSFFALFAKTALVWAILWQTPVFLVFAYRLKVRPHSEAK